MFINTNTRLVDLQTLKPYADYLLYKLFFNGVPAVEMTIAQLHEEQPNWSVDSMICGIERLNRAVQRRRVMYDVYGKDDCLKSLEKKDVKLFFLPTDKRCIDKPFIICIAGGGYTCVCSIGESFPVAARFNELGYNVFVLNYRVGDGTKSLLPEPEEDLAAAIKFIIAHKSEFGLKNDAYVINGFSAGGNLTAVFGGERHGWAKYNCPRPEALFTIYPAISMAAESMEDCKERTRFMRIMFGADYDEEYAQSFNVHDCVTEHYPPCFIVHSKDDPIVPVNQSLVFNTTLQEFKLPVQCEIVETGGHGWGDGNNTAAAGWPERAIQWLESL